MQHLKYLTGYPAGLQEKVKKLIADEQLGPYLVKRYPDTHKVQTDRALYEYCSELKREHLRTGAQIDKVTYDSKLDVVRHALGLHTSISRVQGGKLKAKKEIRIASLFRDAAPEFLKMIGIRSALVSHAPRSEEKPDVSVDLQVRSFGRRLLPATRNSAPHQAATASTTADAVNNTGIDFEVGVPAPSATEDSGTSGFVSG